MRQKLLLTFLLAVSMMFLGNTGCEPPDPPTPPVEKYTISVSANPEEGGTATGGGAYNEGDTVTVEAIENEGYLFINWTEDGNEVSIDVSYMFTVDRDRTLVANFDKEVNPFNPDLEYGEMIDDRDGQTYKTIEIGAQTWMAENLNFNTGNSWCSDDDPANCEIYGMLYDYNNALTACPTGWHLPGDAAWTTLTDFLGGVAVAGGMMKSTAHWRSPNDGATNESGFSALPGGGRNRSGGEYFNFGLASHWWSSTEYESFDAWCRILYYYNPYVNLFVEAKERGLSVRCLKDYK